MESANKNLKKLKFAGSKSTPVYGSFWGWLLNRPTHWLVEVNYTFEPADPSPPSPISCEVVAKNLSPVKIMTETIDHEKTGLLVRDYRRSKNLSIEDIFYRLPYSMDHLNKLESGDAAWTEESFDRIVSAITSISWTNSIRAKFSKQK